MKKLFTQIKIFVMLSFSMTMVQAQPDFIKVLPSNAAHFTGANGKLFFTVGTSLWRSGGSPSSTYFIKEIGEPIQSFTNITVGTFVYFLTTEPGGNTALWKTNGTGVNTFKVASFPVIKPLLSYKNSLIMGVDDGIHGYELWKASSSNVVTMIEDLNPGPGSGLGDEIVDMNNILYFKANTGTGGNNIWKSNGFNHTSLVANLVFDSFGQFTVVNNEIFFARNVDGDTAEIWKTNGSSASGSTVMVKQFLEPDDLCHINISNLISYKNKLSFNLTGGCGADFENLYESDGTDAGTVFIKTVNIDGYISEFMKVNNRLVFYNSSQGFPGSIIRSDGTADGTESFYQRKAEPAGEFERVGNLLFFTDHTEQNFGSIPFDTGKYFQLYQSGLHAENTETFEEIFGISFAGSGNLTNVNGNLYFTTYNDHPSVPVSDRVMKLYYYDPTIVFRKGAMDYLAGNTHSDFSVFPNPSSEMFNFSVKAAAKGLATAEIIRLDGTVVENILKSTVSVGEEITFYWYGQDVPEGVYLCRFTCDNTQQMKKIVVRR